MAFIRVIKSTLWKPFGLGTFNESRQPHSLNFYFTLRKMWNTADDKAMQQPVIKKFHMLTRNQLHFFKAQINKPLSGWKRFSVGLP